MKKRALYGLIVSLAIVTNGCALLKPLESLSFKIWMGSDLLRDYPDVITYWPP